MTESSRCTIQENEGTCGETSSSSSSSSNVDDNSSSTTEHNSSSYDAQESPILPKILPYRETRGRRLQMLVGDDVQVDDEFWKQSTWEDSDSDQEWVPGAEDQPSASSNYSSSSSSDLEASVDGEEAEAQLFKLEREEMRKKNKKKTQLVYRDTKPTRMRTSSDSKRQHLPLMSASRRTTQLKKRKLSKYCDASSQEEHLRTAALTEKVNTQRFNERLELRTWKKTIKQQKESLTRWTGSMELLISWASNRLIGEEDKNLTNVEPFRRQLLFFVDFGDPERSALPIMYETRRHCAEEVQRLQVKKTAFKYRDPLTGKLFSDVGSFQEIRKRENKKNEMLITSSFFSLELKLKKILRYITKHHLVSCVTGTNELTEYSSNPSLNREQNAPPAIASYTGLFECPEKEEETLISKKAKLNRINVFSTPAETQRVMEEGQSLSSNVIPSTEYVGTQEASSTKGGRGIVSSSFTKSEAKSINDRIEKRTNKREADITVSSAPSPVSLHRQPLRIHLTTPKTTMGVATPLGAPDTYGNSCAFSNPLRLPNTLPFGIPMDQSLYLPYNPFLNQYPYVKQFKDISCPGETLSPPCYPPADPFLFPNLMYLNSTSIVLPPSVSFPTPLPCFPLVSNPYAPLNPMNIPINYSTPYFGTPSPPSVSRFPLNTSLRQPSFNAHVRLQRPTATSFGRPHMQPDVNAFTRPVTQPDVDPFTRQ